MSENLTETSEAAIGVPADDPLERGRRSMPRRRFFDDMPDKGLFAAVALIGFLLIVVLKSHFSVGSEIVAVLAVCVMIVYGIVSFYIPAVQMRTDRLGDNFYYLGFIYTLGSLSAALLHLRYSVQVEELLGDFGVALITTVIGVAGRVLFVQMRGDMDQIEEQVRQDLAAASADLRGQLVLSLREFETFQAAVIQTSEETIAKTSHEFASYFANMKGEIVEAFSGLRDELKRGVAEFSKFNRDLIDARGAAVKEANERLTAQMDEIGKVSEATVERIRKLGLDQEAEYAKLVAYLDKLNRALGELPVLSNVQMPSERLRAQVEQLSLELQSLVVELRKALGAADYLRRSQARPRRWYWPFKSRVQSNVRSA